MTLNSSAHQVFTPTVLNLDHLGLVAGLIRRLGIVDIVDKRLSVDKKKGAKLTHGQRLMAMILMGLGFVNVPLYLSSRFFAHIDMKNYWVQMSHWSS